MQSSNKERKNSAYIHVFFSFTHFKLKMRGIYHLITLWSEPRVFSHLFEYHCNIFLLVENRYKILLEVVRGSDCFFFILKALETLAETIGSKSRWHSELWELRAEYCTDFFFSFLILAAELFETLLLPCQILCFFFFLFMSRFCLVSLFEVLFFFLLDWLNK